jgi:hypothetical protein
MATASGSENLVGFLRFSQGTGMGGVKYTVPANTYAYLSVTTAQSALVIYTGFIAKNIDIAVGDETVVDMVLGPGDYVTTISGDGYHFTVREFSIP